MNRIISPSMLSADFGFINRDTQMLQASAAEWIHIDVMDGVFVPNISFGFPVLKAIRSATTKFVDVHLMIVEPQKYVERFVKAGADLVTVHVEAVADLRACVDMIHRAGAKAGVSIKPATPVSVVESVLDVVDLVLIMSVEPGFGGQSFMPESLTKVTQLRRLIDQRGLQTLIEIDGGVSTANAGAIFGAADPSSEIVKMLNSK